MTFESCLVDYLPYLAAKGYTESTVKWHQTKLQRMIRHFQSLAIYDPCEITPEYIEKYCVNLKTAPTYRGKVMAEDTYWDHLAIINAFFQWLNTIGRISQNPVLKDLLERPRKPYTVKLPRVLSKGEVSRILDSYPINTPSGLRNRAILEILYSCGIRRQELINLNVDDIDFEGGFLRVNQGKNRKDRVVPIGETACQFATAYLKLVRWWFLRDPAEPALFISSQEGKRLSFESVRQIVKEAAKKSGITKQVSPHTFRHSMATHLLQNDADIRYIQLILGHAKLETTAIYAHTEIMDLKETLRRAHPHGKRRLTADITDDTE